MGTSGAEDPLVESVDTVLKRGTMARLSDRYKFEFAPAGGMVETVE